MAAPTVTAARRAVLQQLLPHKVSGLTLDELARALGISRTATQQHLTALERDGLVETRATTRRSGGRPSRTFGLTEAGYERFERRYDLLATSMIEAVIDTAGEAALESLFEAMADDLIDRLSPQVVGSTDRHQRVQNVVELMNELGYEAAEMPAGASIAASNCIYHQLAKRTRAVCRFDVRLLAGLLGEPVTHRLCMADGADTCTFHLDAPPLAPPQSDITAQSGTTAGAEGSDIQGRADGGGDHRE